MRIHRLPTASRSLSGAEYGSACWLRRPISQSSSSALSASAGRAFFARPDGDLLGRYDPSHRASVHCRGFGATCRMVGGESRWLRSSSANGRRSSSPCTSSTSATFGGLITSDALGSMLLTLLALGVFVSGLDLRAWKLVRRRRLPRHCGAACRLVRTGGAVSFSHRRGPDRAWAAPLVGRAPNCPPIGAEPISANAACNPPHAPVVAWAAEKAPKRVLNRPRRDLRRRSGWRLKDGAERAGAGQAGREGDFAIALRTPDIARAAAGRRRRDEFVAREPRVGP